VPDKDTATARLEDALAGSDTTTEAFDIKTPEDFGGLEGGETFGFGRRSQDPVETPEGVGVNPIGEELQRKAGASGFVRGESVGADRIDIGPRGPGRTKDPEDALEIARSVAGDDDARVRQFERAFFDDDGSADVSDARLTAGLREFIRDERGQVQLDRQRATGQTFDEGVATPEIEPERRLENVFGEDDTETSPTARGRDTDGSSVPVLSGSAGASGVTSGSAGGVDSDTSSLVAGGTDDSRGLSSLVSLTSTSAAGLSTGPASSATASGVPSTSPAPTSTGLSSLVGSASPRSSPAPSSDTPSTGASPLGGSSAVAGLPGTPSPPARPQPRDREDDDEESDDESLFAQSERSDTFGTGIFTPGEDGSSLF